MQQQPSAQPPFLVQYGNNNQGWLPLQTPDKPLDNAYRPALHFLPALLEVRLLCSSTLQLMPLTCDCCLRL